MGIREDMKAGFDDTKRDLGKLFDLHRESIEKFGEHAQQSAVRGEQVRAIATAAHEKIDEHLDYHEELSREKRSARVALWIGLVLALASVAFAAVKISIG